MDLLCLSTSAVYLCSEINKSVLRCLYLRDFKFVSHFYFQFKFFLSDFFLFVSRL